MDLDENGNLIEPSTRDEHITLWNYCYRNAKYADWTIDCKLVKLDMFGSCESSVSSDSDNIGGINNGHFRYWAQRCKGNRDYLH